MMQTHHATGHPLLQRPGLVVTDEIRCRDPRRPRPVVRFLLHRITSIADIGPAEAEPTDGYDEGPWWFAGYSFRMDERDPSTEIDPAEVSRLLFPVDLPDGVHATAIAGCYAWSVSTWYGTKGPALLAAVLEDEENARRAARSE